MTGAPAATSGLHDDALLHDVHDVQAVVAGSCWPFAGAPTRACGDRRVGLEAEAPAVDRDMGGAPAGRVRVPALAALLDQALGASPVGGPGWRSRAGSVVTLEPGGQVELSTDVAPSAGAAVEALDRATDEVAGLIAGAGAVLAPVGTDPWHDLAEVPQQLDAPRYRAMEAAFARRGGARGPGARMMRLTSSLQVNLDLGPDEATALERWYVATLAGPVLAAAFRSSPGGGRARAWHDLDPSRTGPGPGLAAGADGADAVELLTRAALDAYVLLRRAPDGNGGTGELTAGPTGRTFGAWLASGGAGAPRIADLLLHLTTLWHDVRVRGFLELRTLDALPRTLQPAPVAVVCGLLLDDTARAQGRALLAPWVDSHSPGARPGAGYERLTALAEGPGVAHPRICALAVELSALALEGARRVLPPEDMWMVRIGEEHLDTRTMRGLAPADELAELLADPPAALAWAAAAPRNRPSRHVRRTVPSEPEHV